MNMSVSTSFENQNKTGNGKEHPVNAAHREWMAEKGKGAVSEEDFDRKHKDVLVGFLFDQMEYVPYCKDLHKGKETSCSCFPNMVTSLSDSEVDDVAVALLNFAKMKKNDQQSRVMEWIAYDYALEKHLEGCVHRDVKQMRCVLPGTYNEMICKHRLASLIGYGKKKWMKCAQLVREKKKPKHKAEGKVPNNCKGKVFVYGVILESFFEDLSKLANPRATRIVTMKVDEHRQSQRAELGNVEVQIELRDTNKDLIELPSSMTKRGLYKRFLEENIGIRQTLDAKCRVKKVEVVSSDDEDRDKPEVPGCYPSWRTFNRYWEEKWPHLVVCRAREDICEECWRVANAFRFNTDENNASNNNADDLEEDPNESLIKQASLNVEQAQVQRALFNEKAAEAKASMNLPRAKRTVTWVLDYAQNMGLPHFGKEQPGQTYYLCPLNVYVFGIVDAAVDKLTAFVYNEDIAGKGGNCVASMIMHQVQQQLVPRPCEKDTDPLLELNLVMDNCSGQNKNRHVLRLLSLLVQRGVAMTVNAIFLVRGHTKNPCDRMFNLLKMQTREDNIYTPPMLFDALNTQKGVRAVTFSDFFDWDSFENEHMRVNVPKVKSFHLFTVDKNDNDGVYMSRYSHLGGKEDKVRMIAEERQQDLSWIWKEPKAISAVGLPDIKHVELHDKWKPLVPQQYWKDFIYFTEAPDANKRKRVREQKRDGKKARRERQRETVEGQQPAK